MIHGLKEENGGTISTVEFANRLGKATKEVKINFYCPEEKKQVAEPTVVVNADATCVNSSAYAALVPAGYELVEVGDMPIRDGYVYAEVRKVATKTIKINYYSEEEEKQIAEVEMTVPADATYVNTSKLTAPAGYELVLAGDLPSVTATFTLLSVRFPPPPSRSPMLTRLPIRKSAPKIWLSTRVLPL